jgi:hypothetical protein
VRPLLVVNPDEILEALLLCKPALKFDQRLGLTGVET